MKLDELAPPYVLVQPRNHPAAPRRKPVWRLAPGLAFAAALVLAVLLGGWWAALAIAAPVLGAFGLLCHGAWWIRHRAGPDFFR
ncbi:hypothetical protein ACFOM8_18875 [Paracoccus angustae]|uniref:Uncharacterized protein n=1 Tax=Paracoccus angustae TaxID=1671480 RepID=A0ABV7U8Q6_9RHOB